MTKTTTKSKKPAAKTTKKTETAAKTKKPVPMLYLKATEIVRETEKAVLLRRWIGMGVDPKTNARQQWFPKAVIEKVYFNGSKSGPGIPTIPGDYWMCKTWFVGKEELWSWVQG